MSIFHSSTKLSASRFDLTKAQSSLVSLGAPSDAPDQCVPLLNFATHNFTLTLSDEVEIHFVGIRFYGLNLKNMWITNKIRIELSVATTYCHLYGANHLDSDLNNHYLTLGFECNQSSEAITTEDITLSIALKNQSVKWIFLCYLNVYYFDEGCGEPDLPTTMIVRRMTFSWYYLAYDYECRNAANHLMRGNPHIECGPYGKWTNKFATCVPKEATSCMTAISSWASQHTTLIVSFVFCVIPSFVIICVLSKLFAISSAKLVTKQKKIRENKDENRKSDFGNSNDNLYDDVFTGCDINELKTIDESPDDQDNIYEKIK